MQVEIKNYQMHNIIKLAKIIKIENYLKRLIDWNGPSTKLDTLR